jgi:Protein of unknown function (DUF3237)
MLIRRREVLKAVGAALVGFAPDAFAENHVLIPNERKTAMTSRPLMRVNIAAAPPQQLGTGPHGIRSIVPVTGGSFEGPRLRGKVLPGGGDWLLLRPDGVLELDLRITLETDDHALIYMTFQGLRHGDYFRTLPRFETSTESYAFLNRIVSVGVGEARPDGAVHQIDEIL